MVGHDLIEHGRNRDKRLFQQAALTHALEIDGYGSPVERNPRIH